MTSRRAQILLAVLFVTIVDCESLAQAQNSKGQWLVVVPSTTRQAIAPLIKHRMKQGFQIAVHEASPKISSKQLAEIVTQKCGAFPGKSCVLLVGDWSPSSELHLPAGLGTHGRMAGRWTDHVYGAPDEASAATVAVGRFPARTLPELKGMVEKTLRFETQKYGAWTNRFAWFVGHPGGRAKFEQQAAEGMIQSVVNARLGSLHPRWRVSCVDDLPNSPFYVGERFCTEIPKLLSRGNLFACYAGHSSPHGIATLSKGQMTATDFGQLDIVNSPGVFVTTGCYSCQIKGLGGTGFAVAAMRNPRGSAAVIGAFGESYAAPGQLALDGLLKQLDQEPLARDLGGYWLAAQAGLARGKMNPVTFWLYDQADGTGGKVPLNKQRPEHLEMWTLLGDPAAQLPIHVDSLKLSVRRANNLLVVEARVDDETFDDVRATIVVESRLTSQKPDENGTPVGFGATLESATAQVKDQRLNCEIEVPSLPVHRELVVRVSAVNKEGTVVTGARLWKR